MAQDYSEYLAVNVLNERQLVTFRALSRALKVHSNLAKQMLFDFHHRQNSKKPASVHATYLITGYKHVQTDSLPSRDGEDSVMQSDNVFPSSSFPEKTEQSDDAPTSKTIMLVREEHLEHARATFERITGMHVYSLQADGLSDVQTLTECNRRIASSYASEDPLTAWKQYGTIQNPNVRRRTGKPPPAPPAVASKLADSKSKPAAGAGTSNTKAAAPTKPLSDSQPSSQDRKANSSKPSATLKRQDSNLFKSFAKASAAKPKTTTAATASPAESQDTPMTGFSDDDDNDEDQGEGDSGLPDELREVNTPAAGGKSRKEREAELQAMMEQEDEAMADGEAEADTPASGAGTGDGEDDEGQQAEDEDDDDSGAIDRKPEEGSQESAQAGAQQEEAVASGNGRRRGRRRVMKMKTVKDEEGYLVTREKPAWESFSEDEPAPKKPKVDVAAAAGSGSKQQSKKASKVGQGNIMSFFAKK